MVHRRPFGYLGSIHFVVDDSFHLGQMSNSLGVVIFNGLHQSQRASFETILCCFESDFRQSAVQLKAIWQIEHFSSGEESDASSLLQQAQ